MLHSRTKAFGAFAIFQQIFCTQISTHCGFGPPKKPPARVLEKKYSKMEVAFGLSVHILSHFESQVTKASYAL